jgi:predicted ATPase
LAAPPPPLIGRKKELLDVLRLFRRDDAKAVTITGPEGVGKTRFAHEVVAELGGEVELVDDGDTTRLVAPRGDAEHVYRLRPLAEAPAVELFRQLAPDVDAGYHDIADAVARVGRLPRAIEELAARGSLD